MKRFRYDSGAVNSGEAVSCNQRRKSNEEQGTMLVEGDEEALQRGEVALQTSLQRGEEALQCVKEEEGEMPGCMVEHEGERSGCVVGYGGSQR